MPNRESLAIRYRGLLGPQFLPEGVDQLPFVADQRFSAPGDVIPGSSVYSYHQTILFSDAPPDPEGRGKRVLESVFRLPPSIIPSLLPVIHPSTRGQIWQNRKYNFGRRKK